MKSLMTLTKGSIMYTEADEVAANILNGYKQWVEKLPKFAGYSSTYARAVTYVSQHMGEETQQVVDSTAEALHRAYTKENN